MPNRTLQKLFYAMLFILIFGTIFILISQIFQSGSLAWEIYGKIYLAVLLGYTWYTYILLFIDDIKKRTYPEYNNEKIMVIMPCYNESPELLERAIESIALTRGNKEIIIFDDGSTNNIQENFYDFERRYNVKIYGFKKNKGKRHALHYAIKNLIGDSKFVVTIDSDTILDREALVKIVEPLKDPDIGAATGDVRLLNEKQNWLTRMIATYYWIGLNVYKQAQSTFGNVVCCSGCIAAYKGELVVKIIDEFLNQEFFGEKCTHSEDRHLTNLVLKNGLKVVYIPESISWTYTPDTIVGFLKQQQRWKRGFIRESIYTLSYAWKERKLLFLQVLLWDLTAPFLTFGLRVAVLITTILNPMYFFSFMLPAWIIFMLARYIMVILHAPKKIPGLFTYMIFYEVFLYWMNIYALFSVKNKSWITR